MNDIRISGLIIDRMIYVNRVTTSIDLYQPFNPENNFGRLGWWFPNDSIPVLEEILITGKDTSRDERINHNGTLFNSNGDLIDYRLCGDNYRLSFHHAISPITVIATERSGAYIGSYIEFLSTRPEFDTQGLPWTLDRVKKVLGHFIGNFSFDPFITVDELKERLSKKESVPLAPFSRKEKEWQ